MEPARHDWFILFLFNKNNDLSKNHPIFVGITAIYLDGCESSVDEDLTN